MSSWTPALVEARLSEAAFVLKRLPEPRLSGYFSTWPEVVQSFADKVEQQPKPMRLLPSPAAISRMEETLTWTAGLAPMDGKIVWPPPANPYVVVGSPPVNGNGGVVCDCGLSIAGRVRACWCLRDG